MEVLDGGVIVSAAGGCAIVSALCEEQEPEPWSEQLEQALHR